MTIYGSAPEPDYMRTQGRSPMGCGGTCPMCRPMAEQQARRRAPAAGLPEGGGRERRRAEKDPRNTRL